MNTKSVFNLFELRPMQLFHLALKQTTPMRHTGKSLRHKDNYDILLTRAPHHLN